MTRSQNGYPIIVSTTSRHLRPWTWGGVRLTGRSGPEGFVLAHYVQWFDEDVERLWAPDMPEPGTPADDHWYGQRFIGGTTVPSNHWSATAVDLNALRHSQGTAPEETFTATQCRRIDTKMRDKYPVLKWGGRFSTTPDSMHVELRTLGTEITRAQVRALALELVQTPVGKRLIAAQAKPVHWEKW